MGRKLAFLSVTVSHATFLRRRREPSTPELGMLSALHLQLFVFPGVTHRNRRSVAFARAAKSASEAV